MHLDEAQEASTGRQVASLQSSATLSHARLTRDGHPPLNPAPSTRLDSRRWHGKDGGCPTTRGVKAGGPCSLNPEHRDTPSNALALSRQRRPPLLSGLPRRRPLGKAQSSCGLQLCWSSPYSLPANMNAGAFPGQTRRSGARLCRCRDGVPPRNPELYASRQRAVGIDGRAGRQAKLESEEKGDGETTMPHTQSGLIDESVRRGADAGGRGREGSSGLVPAQQAGDRRGGSINISPAGAPQLSRSWAARTHTRRSPSPPIPYRLEPIVTTATSSSFLILQASQHRIALSACLHTPSPRS